MSALPPSAPLLWIRAWRLGAGLRAGGWGRWWWGVEQISEVLKQRLWLAQHPVGQLRSRASVGLTEACCIVLREELPLQSLRPLISVCLPGLPCGTLQLPSRCYVLRAALLAPRLPQSCTQLPQVEAPGYMARQAADAACASAATACGASLSHAPSLACCWLS